MKLQHEHKVISSFMLFLEHYLASRGKAYTNHTSDFYPVENNTQNYYTYGAPFQQFVFDDSVGFSQNGKTRKPEIPSGVYLNNAYIQPGESGLAAIDYNKGQLHFSQDYPGAANILPRASYAVKDLNIYLTNEPEHKLLFETKYKISPKTQQDPTGLPPDVQTYPALYIKNLTSTNTSLSMGSRLHDTENYIRVIALCDSAYLLDAACSLLKDLGRKRMPLLEASEQPLGPLGYIGGEPFNYKNVVSGKYESEDNHLIIYDVNVTKKSQNMKDFDNLNTEVFVGFIDFTLKNWRELD